MMAGLLPLAFAVLALVDITFSCQVINGVKLTNYGYPDTPHPHQPAYKCNNESVIPTQLGDLPLLGNGSYGSPYSAAARDGSEFGKCELLYVPILKKYFRVSDDCWACSKCDNACCAAEFLIGRRITACRPLPHPSEPGPRPIVL